MSDNFSILLSHPDKVAEIAKAILNAFSESKVFAFLGEMGAGKTTLIKGFCSMLEVDDVVTSPTFSVINEYCCRNGDLVYHFDFYRIKNETEAWNLGAVDLFDSGHYCFIEWPSNARALLPPETIFLEIIRDDNNVVRNIILRNTID